MKKINQLKTGAKITIALCLSMAVILIGFGIYTYKDQSKSLLEEADLRLSEQAADLAKLIEVQVEKNRKDAVAFGELAYNLFIEEGSLYISDNQEVKVSAINQESNSIINTEIPVLMKDGLPLYQNYSFVDRISEMTGGTATVFQKFEGGFLRISTNVTNSSNERAINSFIPSSSPVAQALNSGSNYTGRAVVMDEWFNTYYKPFRINGEIVGAVYYGTPEKDMSQLAGVFAAKEYYENGYPYAVATDGTLVIHPISVGVNIADEYFFKQSLKESEGKIEYEWEGEMKYQYFKHVNGADMIVCATVNKSDIVARMNQVRNTIIMITLFGIAIAILIGFLIGRNISSIIEKVIGQTKRLIDAAVSGQLDARANTEETNFEFRPIVQGINDTLDAVINPLNVAAEYIDRISKGDIPAKITDNYNGDFNEIKNNLNGCIDAVNELIADAVMLSGAAVEGKFSTRANASNHQGDFRKIVQGVNDTLDVVVDKIFWYEQMLDSIPFPISVTDMEMNWTFFNKAAEGVTGKTRKEMLGKQCSNWGADICNTEKCGISLLKKGTLSSFFEQPGIDKNFQVDTAYLVDENGKQIGHIEIVQDVTKAQKISDYNKTEVERLAQNLVKLSKGDVGCDLNVATPDEYTESEFQNFSLINKNLSEVLDAINLLVSDANMLVDAAVDGKLDVRADASAHQGDFRKIVQGVNNTLDAVINPLNVAAEYVDRISKGDIPAKITDNYNGDFNEIKNNLNGCIDSLNGLISEMNHMSEQHDLGDIDVTIDAAKFEGAYHKMAQGVNDMVFGHIAVKKKAMACVKEFGEGNFEAELEQFPGKKVFINEIVEQVRTNLKALISDANMLANAAVEGRLNTRADEGKHQGDFRAIVEGVNNTLDTLVGFLDNMPAPAMIIDKDFTIQYMNETGAKLDNKKGKDLEGTKCYDHFKTKDCRTSNCACAKTMSSGQFSESSTQANPGNLNLEIDYSAVPVKDKKGTVIGAFEVVSDQTAARNAMKKAEKVNQYQVLEANKLTEALDKFAKGDLEFKLVTEKSDEDTVDAKAIFDNINEAVTTTADKVRLLIDDTNVLAEAAVEGKLTTRADAGNHEGDFRKIVQGVNNTLDAVIGPLNVAATYVAKISVGDMPEKITDNYNGDFNVIKENLNILIGALNEITEKAQMVADGDLTVDLKKRSENDELMESLNEMVKSTASIISEFQNASENISASSQQMSSTSQQISQGATEQASSAEEVSSSMEQMLANIQQNTDNAQQTEKIALNASEGIGNVSKASNQTLKFMQEIADKISIIGEISRETNILALNAAVEAARAGEHGKGFAVVAAEVRKLAERSQISAVEIDELTKNSVKATDESSKLLEAIAPEIGKTAKLVQEIAAASIEQSSGADQVNNAIQQLNQVTQQNAAASEEMATSSEEQASQSEQLLEMIAFFKLLEEKGKKRNATRKNEKAVNPAIKSSTGSNGHAKSTPKKPAPAKSSTDENKKVIIDMGKDNLDKNYETF